MNNVIECRDLKKYYREGTYQVDVLSSVNLQIREGESVAIVGPSGSGKSTLLHLLGGLDKPTAGEVLVQGKNFALLTEKQRCELRNRYLGFVYQFHHLLPEFTVLENVSIPLLIQGCDKQTAASRASILLEKVNLSHRASHKISEISGGERQRAAIARAMVVNPACILADEPTGNLDQHTAENVLEVLLSLNREAKTSLVIVTHDLKLAARLNRCYQMREGFLVEG